MTNTTNPTKGREFVSDENLGSFLSQLAAAIIATYPEGDGGSATVGESRRTVKVVRGELTMDLHFNPSGRYMNPCEKLEVSVSDPAYQISYDREGSPRATVSTNRPLHSLARDLRRRVIEPGWIYVAERTERMKRAEGASEVVTRCAQQLQAASPWEVSVRSEATGRDPRATLAIHGPYLPHGPYQGGKIGVSSRGERGPVVDLDLHGLSEDQAKAILALLR